MLGEMARFYTDGGFFMHPILMAGMFGGAAVVVQFVTLKTKFNPLPISLAVMGSLVMLGVLGTIIGIINAFEAMALAPPDMKTAMITASISIALNTTAFATMLLVPLIVPCGVAAALRPLFQNNATTGESRGASTG